MRLRPAGPTRGAGGRARGDLAARGCDRRWAERGRRPAALDHRRPVVYLLLGALTTASVAGAPLAVYDLARLAALGTRRQRAVAAVGCAPFLVAVAGRAPKEPVLDFVVVCALAALLALRTYQEETTRTTLHATRDDLREKVLTLQDTNARLLQAQDHESRAAVLSERTRIAREIHDGVGTSSPVSCCRSRLFRSPTVTSPPSSPTSPLWMRGSTRPWTPCADPSTPCRTRGRIWQPLSTCWARVAASPGCTSTAPLRPSPAGVERCVVAVVREALTNAARHGGAHSARVAVTDYPAFWQVTVDNDGVVPFEDEPAVDDGRSPGLGLRSMTERVEALGGRVRITPRASSRSSR